VVKEIWTWVKI